MTRTARRAGGLGMMLAMRTTMGGWVLLACACAGDGGGQDDAAGSSDTVATGTAEDAGPGDGTSADDGDDGSPGPGGVDTADDTDGGTTDDPATDEGTDDTGEPVELADVHYVGRFDLSDPANPRASWPGSMVRLRIDGTSLSIDLDGAGGVYFQVAVDGEPTAVFETNGGAQTYEVVSGLSAGEHDIELVRRNEGFFGVVGYGAITPGADTTIVPTPVATRRIELVGDSLTAGYGIECASGDDNFSGETENAYLTYGMVAARIVGADPHVIAHSGIGAAQNYGGNTDGTMPERYPRIHTDDASLSWDFGSWVPDVVLLNLGTNDFSAPIDMPTFVDAYAGLVADIREANPNAALMAVTWAHWGAEHEGWVHAALAQAGEDDATVLQFTIDPDDGYGCDYHTNVVTNAAFGQQLADALTADLGW